MRITVFTRYFRGLANGDPVALIMTGIFITFLIVVGVVMLRFRATEKQEEEQKRRKWGLKTPKEKK